MLRSTMSTSFSTLSLHVTVVSNFPAKTAGLASRKGVGLTGRFARAAAVYELMFSKCDSNVLA